MMMMMMGDILASARGSARAFQSWLDVADTDFAETVRDAACRASLDAAGYARQAVAAFDRFATETDWSALLRAIRDSDDPGMAGLSQMIRWQMARDMTAAVDITARGLLDEPSTAG